jgi:menaquinone-dependent protoporphyrinogen oxidase
MAKKILVAYGTAAGSTAEVAQAVGEEMEKAGLEATVQPVEEVISLEGYDAVVVGTAVRAFRILPKTRRFMRKHRQALRQVPAAYFLVCLTMGEDTPENVKQAIGYAKPMIKIKEPVDLGLFGGCLIHDNLTDMFGKAMKNVPEQDHRDWDKIRAWAGETLPKLVEMD